MVFDDKGRECDDSLADEAMAWFLTMKDPGATEADRRRFEAWLQGSEERAAAFAEAQALWEDVGVPAGLMAERERQRKTPRRLAKAPAWAAAACLLLMVSLAAGLWRDPGIVDRWLADLATPPGRSQAVTLDDGSRLFLDADSAVDVEMTAERRQLTLRRGRLWVDVVSEPERAFSVVAGEATTQVLGTRFAVERHAGEVRVTVEEGRVAVSPTGDRSTEAQRTTLEADQALAIHHGAMGAPRDVDASVRLAWTRGQLIFDRAPLGEVAEQLERMAYGRVLVTGEGSAAHRLSGSFPADDPGALLDALEASLGIDVRRLPGTVWLSASADE
ncbi:FecR family protein [Billgrantia gudaonensis]|uniref:FecR family protein n=1 Tax=Billgrantia gudaonensis TaxID=376427 RepID=A0A1G8VQY7_9GAMM|nr:FecR domain-containing protein [Halomonas gudaonensis]SDJ68528.1 FecR family protein [Halomonas gudaonensis]